MKNFNDIIFFGLIAVAVIRNIIKFSNKQKSAANKPIFQEVIQDIFEEKEAAPAVEKREKLVIHKEERHNRIEEKAKIFNQEPTIETPISEEINYDFSDISDMRKAVIYSEILNKKY